MGSSPSGSEGRRGSSARSLSRSVAVSVAGRPGLGETRPTVAWARHRRWTRRSADRRIPVGQDPGRVGRRVHTRFRPGRRDGGHGVGGRSRRWHWFPEMALELAQNAVPPLRPSRDDGLARRGLRELAMTTFVLVHGAWSGAHGFHKVRRLLADAGHDVFTPSLTGIGERAHLLSPLIDLTTHVHDVVNVVLYEDLDEIVLVGFSYGGVVVDGSGRPHRRPDPRAGLSRCLRAERRRQRRRALRSPTSAGAVVDQEWLVPPLSRSFDDPVEGAWQSARRGPHPARCFTEAVRLTRPLEEQPFGLTYIKATDDGREAPGGEAFWAAADARRSSDRWKYFEIATTHMVASNRPEELSRILLQLA